MAQELSYDVETLRSTLRLACILDDLKTRIRTGWKFWRVRSKRLESVSEHCHSCLLLANMFYPIYPDRDQINLARVNQMLIWHEIGETVIDDIALIDKRRHENKAESEHRAWRKLLSGLPYEQDVYDLLIEFDEHKTPDAKFSFYIDKFDAMKTMKHYYDLGKFHRLAWSMKHCEKIKNNEDIQKLVKEGAKDPVDIWFADIYIAFHDDAFFMDAQRVIREMNTNIEPPSV